MTTAEKKESIYLFEQIVDDKITFKELMKSLPKNYNEDEDIRILLDMVQHWPAETTIWGGDNMNEYKEHEKMIREFLDKVINNSMKENNIERVKISFRLRQDEDGYPPATTETVWAKKISENEYKIDNVPFYVRGISLGDIVSVTYEDEELVYERLITPSDISTLRVIIMDKNNKEETELNLRKYFIKSGCAIEGISPVMFAIEVPASVNLKPIIEYLAEGEKNGLWGYEEAALRQ